MVGAHKSPGGRTLAEKVWDAHTVRSVDGEPDLLYIDLHLVHEVTSPQAFDGLRLAGRKVRRPELTLATEDHNTPTDNLVTILDPISRTQIETLRRNCEEFGVRLHSLGDVEQGIVHVIGPQLGITQPGMTIVCGDSHTATHGAFGALAFGIGTSEVEHVLATQTLPQAKPKTMAVNVVGELPPGVTAKDLVLALITQVGTGGGVGYVVEYRGEAIEKLSMEGRMTISNMSIEWGARAGLIAPDETTFAYLKDRPYAPKGEDWDRALEYWRSLPTDADAVFDDEVTLDASSVTPFVTWGTNPGQGASAERGRPVADRLRRPGRGLGGRAGAGLHGPYSRARRCARWASTWSSWGPAPTAGWRICAPPPPCCGATRWPTGYGCSWFPVRRRFGPQPRPRAWTRSSPRRAPSGGSPAVPCVWA